MAEKKSLHDLGSKSHQSYYKLCDLIDAEVIPSPCTSNFFGTVKKRGKERKH
jgi:hypothetical protein